MNQNASLYGLEQTALDAIIDIGKLHNLEQIILFGSRARGDYKDRSDIDLAVYGENADLFGIDIEEAVPTLLKFDIVNMNKPIQAELTESIKTEGVVIYEKV